MAVLREIPEAYCRQKKEPAMRILSVFLSFQLDYQPGSGHFSLYFRAVLAHHMMRFSSRSRSTEATVPKMYPQFLAFTQLKITLFSVFRKMLLHHSASVNKDNTDSY